MTGFKAQRMVTRRVTSSALRRAGALGICVSMASVCALAVLSACGSREGEDRVLEKTPPKASSPRDDLEDLLRRDANAQTREEAPEGQGEGTCGERLAVGVKVRPSGSMRYVLTGEVAPECAQERDIVLSLRTPVEVEIVGAVRCGKSPSDDYDIVCRGAASAFVVSDGSVSIPMRAVLPEDGSEGSDSRANDDDSDDGVVDDGSASGPSTSAFRAFVEFVDAPVE
jgi:hypothetical protein